MMVACKCLDRLEAVQKIRKYDDFLDLLPSMSVNRNGGFDAASISTYLVWEDCRSPVYYMFVSLKEGTLEVKSSHMP